MKQPLIIETPSLQSLRQRYAYALLTLAFWVLWFYLWIPVISLVAWLLGVKAFYREMIFLDGLHEQQELLIWYGLTIAIVGICYISWALYNQFRFRGRERRLTPPVVTVEELAGDFDLDPALVSTLQEAKRIRIVHDEQGRIRRIRSWRVRGGD